LGVNTGDLKNSVAPCVLAFAELHQRFYTAKVAGERAEFSQKMPGTKAEEELLRFISASQETTKSATAASMIHRGWNFSKRSRK